MKEHWAVELWGLLSGGSLRAARKDLKKARDKEHRACEETQTLMGEATQLGLGLAHAAEQEAKEASERDSS